MSVIQAAWPISGYPARAPFAPRPLVMTVEPDQRPWRMRCPGCGDSDLVAIEHLALGIAGGMRGKLEGAACHYRCLSCDTRSQAITLACSSVADPAGVGHCEPRFLAQLPDETEHFAATAASGEVWRIVRRHYRTGSLPGGDGPLLPRGPFIVDHHLFGPAKRLSAGAGAVALLERLAPAARDFAHGLASRR